MRKHADGFTLVELMVVVLIIGILVAIAVPVFKSAKTDAEKNTCQANQRMWASVVQAIKADDKEPVYWAGKSGETLWSGSLWGTVAEGAYLRKVPVCPSAVDGYLSLYCVVVGPPGTTTNGTIYADHWKVGDATWSSEHSLGLGTF